MPFQMHSVAAFDDAKLVFFFEKHVRMLVICVATISKNSQVT